MGCSPWGREESDTTERLQFHFHFSLSCIGEGNGTPLQCSCLENPRDGGAWWASVSGVAQSRTRLKQLRSSSSSTLALLPPLAIVNNAAVGIGVQLSLSPCFSVLLEKYPEVELLDYMVILWLDFEECQTIFHSSCTISHSPRGTRGFQFLHTNTCYFPNSHANGYKVISHCSFDLHFPKD